MTLAELHKSHIKNNAGWGAPLAFVDGRNTKTIYYGAARARSRVASPRWSPVDLKKIHPEL
jgi:hypothetical protein